MIRPVGQRNLRLRIASADREATDRMAVVAGAMLLALALALMAVSVLNLV